MSRFSIASEDKVLHSPIASSFVDTGTSKTRTGTVTDVRGYTGIARISAVVGKIVSDTTGVTASAICSIYTSDTTAFTTSTLVKTFDTEDSAGGSQFYDLDLKACGRYIRTSAAVSGKLARAAVCIVGLFPDRGY